MSLIITFVRHTKKRQRKYGSKMKVRSNKIGNKNNIEYMPNNNMISVKRNVKSKIKLRLTYSVIFFGEQMFLIHQIINVLRNLGNYSCSPKIFWGTWGTAPVPQRPFEELWGTCSPSSRDSRCPLWMLNFIYLISINVCLVALSKSLANIK